jgi:hypothetical protein
VAVFLSDKAAFSLEANILPGETTSEKYGSESHLAIKACPKPSAPNRKNTLHPKTEVRGFGVMN